MPQPDPRQGGPSMPFPHLEALGRMLCVISQKGDAFVAGRGLLDYTPQPDRRQGGHHFCTRGALKDALCPNSAGRFCCRPGLAGLHATADPQRGGLLMPFQCLGVLCVPAKRGARGMCPGSPSPEPLLMFGAFVGGWSYLWLIWANRRPMGHPPD
ncbi:hypothetical protein NDU88_000597 [Pleurodeles waltl]|uniref:Uncharacterized protein n=1 Tax=Pleurodeles waltl TaxID=8319 RepID=A0AAV7SX48_PLEWA|nr:hypothetical protein NDU88_000597 [Pleurodeles waltl]